MHSNPDLLFLQLLVYKTLEYHGYHAIVSVAVVAIKYIEELRLHFHTFYFGSCCFMND